MGISEAACVLIGNNIGANNVPKALKIAKMTLVQAMSVALLVSSLTCYHADILLAIFTDKYEGIDTSQAVGCI